MKIVLTIFVFFITLIGYSQTNKLDSLVDSWHKAATNAKFNNYFDFMSENSVFIGTAPGERWSKIEFMAFSKPFFDKGKAWDFKANNRKWSFSKDGNTAWFDEELETWMESCRGSGVLIKDNNVWKLAFYDLHVQIENEKIKEFIVIRKK